MQQQDQGKQLQEDDQWSGHESPPSEGPILRAWIGRRKGTASLVHCVSEELISMGDTQLEEWGWLQ